jgi:hypothetical protein
MVAEHAIPFIVGAYQHGIDDFDREESGRWLSVCDGHSHRRSPLAWLAPWRNRLSCRNLLIAG